MKNSMPHVFTRLRSNTFTFMATERPILSVSEIKRDVRLPVKDKNLFLSHDIKIIIITCARFRNFFYS